MSAIQLKTQLTALQNMVGALGHALSQMVARSTQDLRGPVTNRNWLKLSCHRWQYARQLSHGHPIAASVIVYCYFGHDLNSIQKLIT